MFGRCASRVGLSAVRREDAGVGLLQCAVLPSGLFNAFHMRVFLLRGLTSTDVVRAHSVYWVWNIANDIFAGYWVDRFCAIFGSRLPLVRMVSFVWIVVAVLPFVDIGLDPFLHYFVCIMLFDGCMTVVCIARGSLVSELGDNEQHRISIGRVQTLCALPEALVTLTALSLWELPTAFNCVLVFACALSVVFVEVGYRLCRSHARPAAAGTGPQPFLSVTTYLRQLRGQRNFWAFVGMNCIMEMQGTFHDQFNPIIADVLAPATSSAILPLLGVVGFLTAYIVTLVADRSGTYKIYCCAILGKVGVSGAAFVLPALGVPLSVTAVFTMVLVQVSMSSACKFFDVTVASLADEYAIQSGTEVDVTSRMYATHAVFAKPLNSLAPIISTQVLSLEAYRSMKSSGSEATEALTNQALRLLVAFPFAVGTLQWLSWRHFTLYGRELHKQQEHRRIKTHSNGKL